MNSNIINELMDIQLNNSENSAPENANQIEMENYFSSAINDIDNFNEKAWNKGNGIKLPKYKQIEDKMEGLDSGLYLFAGASNHGKSAIMLNIMEDACTCEENNLFGIYFSLDDSKNEIIPRLVAMDQDIPIGVVSKPQRYRNMINQEFENLSEESTSEEDSISSLYQGYLDKREIGLERLKAKCNRLKIEDSNKIKNVDDMYDYINKVITYIKTVDENYKIMIAVDSINDIQLVKKPLDNDKLAEIARIVKQWTVEFDCIILASTHIRKLNGNRRPQLDDLKDSIVLTYEASVVFIVYNDVSANNHSAKIYNFKEGSNEKQPIIELHWSKNKKSSYKGKSFCYFIPEYSKTIECDSEAIRRYSALIYEE